MVFSGLVLWANLMAHLPVALLPTPGSATVAVASALVGVVQDGPPPTAEANEDPSIEEDDEESEGHPPGRWRRFRTHQFDHDLTDEQRAEIERLESIGYLGGTTEPGPLSGVTVHDRDKAYTGLNFYTSGHGPEAILMDMDGKVLHKWSYDFWEVWPDYPAKKGRAHTTFWRRAYLYPNGDVLAIFEGLGIIKLDKNSRLLWASPCRAHHDLDVLPDGKIYVLTREARMVPSFSEKKPVLEDFVSILDAADGKELRRVSLLEAMQKSEFRGMVRTGPGRYGDIFHTNTLEVLDGRHADKSPHFKKGNWLVSLLRLNAVAIVDPDQEKVVWLARGSWLRQHQPTLLDNGRMLIFDNNTHAKWSSVIEIDPLTGKETWRYQGSEEKPFYTETCGSNIRLPNGNTLITESDNGRAFEVTRDTKKTVWEYISPHRAGEEGEWMATLCEVVRLGPDFPTGWLKEPSASNN